MTTNESNTQPRKIEDNKLQEVRAALWFGNQYYRAYVSATNWNPVRTYGNNYAFLAPRETVEAMYAETVAEFGNLEDGYLVIDEHNRMQANWFAGLQPDETDVDRVYNAARAAGLPFRDKLEVGSLDFAPSCIHTYNGEDEQLWLMFETSVVHRTDSSEDPISADDLALAAEEAEEAEFEGACRRYEAKWADRLHQFVLQGAELIINEPYLHGISMQWPMGISVEFINDETGFAIRTHVKDLLDSTNADAMANRLRDASTVCAKLNRAKKHEDRKADAMDTPGNI